MRRSPTRFSWPLRWTCPNAGSPETFHRRAFIRRLPCRRRSSFWRPPGSDATTHLLLPYILAAQAQKHVTHNEALRILDGLVQLSTLDWDLTSPPGSPSDGDRYIVASGATGDWAGWDLNVALRTDGAWLRLPPRTGWRAWVEDEGVLLVYDGAGWVGTAPLSSHCLRRSDACSSTF